MNTRSIFTKLSIAIALVAIASTVTVWQVRRARAMPTAVEDQPTFGMLGITHGQTVRLNVVNLTPPDANRGELAPPCRVVLTFRDANGRPFTDSNGQVVRREVSLQSGESAFLDLNGDTFGPPSTNGDFALARLQLRPFVRLLSAPPAPDHGNIPPDPCRATAEVLDNASGRTSIFAAGFANPPDPDRTSGQ